MASPTDILLRFLRGDSPPADLTEADWQSIVATASCHGLAPLLYWTLARQPFLNGRGIPARPSGADASSAEVSQAPTPEPLRLSGADVSSASSPPPSAHSPAFSPHSCPSCRFVVEVPPAVLSSLQQTFLKTAARNTLVYHDLAQVLTTLQSAGIKVAVLKGAHLAALVYPHLGLRPMADIDLLVPAGQLEPTHTLLLSPGYTPRNPLHPDLTPNPTLYLSPPLLGTARAPRAIGGAAPPKSASPSGPGIPAGASGQDASSATISQAPPPEPLGPGGADVPSASSSVNHRPSTITTTQPSPPPASGVRYPASASRPRSAKSGIHNPQSAFPTAKHLPPYDKPPHPRIEIHWTIANPQLALAVDSFDIISRLRPATIAGVATHVLSPEDLLLYQCTHLAGHRFSCHGLRPIADLAAILDHHRRDLDWSVLATRAREWQAQLHVYLALRLAHELLLAPLQPGFLEQLRPSDFDDRLYDFARESLFQVASEAGADEIEDNFSRVRALADGVTGTTILGKLRFLFHSAFPSRKHMAAYMALFYSKPLTGHYCYTCYLVRLRDLLLHGLRLCRYSVTHRQETRRRTAQLKRQAMLWRWLTSNSASGSSQ